MISNQQGNVSSYHWESEPSSGSGAVQFSPWPEDIQASFSAVTTEVDETLHQYMEDGEGDPRMQAEIFATHANVLGT